MTPVQPWTDKTSSAARSSPRAVAGAEDPARALDLFTDPHDLIRRERPTPHEADQSISPWLLRAWDDALTACVAESGEPGWLSAAVETSASHVAEPPASAPESAWTAGVAVALWGAWEVGSRRDARRRRRPTTRHGGW